MPGVGCALRAALGRGDLRSAVHVQATVPTPPGTARPLGQPRTEGPGCRAQDSSGKGSAVGEARLRCLLASPGRFLPWGWGVVVELPASGAATAKAPSKLRKPHLQTNNVAGGPQGTRPGSLEINRQFRPLSFLQLGSGRGNPNAALFGEQHFPHRDAEPPLGQGPPAGRPGPSRDACAAGGGRAPWAWQSPARSSVPMTPCDTEAPRAPGAY